jgi:WD40 repeat protein
MASEEEARSQGKLALARALAALSDLAYFDDSRGLELTALLASESIRLWPTFDGDRARRRALNLLPRTRSVLVHQGNVNGLAFSPDGKWVATASFDGTARVMETATGREVSRLAHQGSGLGVAFSPDGKWVATASLDGTARVIDRLVTRIDPGVPSSVPERQ